MKHSDQSPALVVVDSDLTPSAEDVQMGEQLTAQYQRAIGGMAEVLRFGAMMMMLREKLSTCGQLRPGRKSKDDNDGISDWLRTYAPSVARSTAYRFLNVAKSVAESFKVPAKITFAELVTTDKAELPPKLALKQAELWEYVSGTSQRSWLDRFTPKGGYRERPNGTHRRTKDELDFDNKEKMALRWHKIAWHQFLDAQQSPVDTWLHLPELQLANFADVLKRLSKEVDEVCRSRKIVPSKLADWHLKVEAEAAE